jgi:arylsulfatase A-like enzyme
VVSASSAAMPNVVLIVFDTLRADHMDLYGYDRITMPKLTAFASGATVYLECTASSPWSLPSHATLFTGLPTRQHGAHYGSAERGEAHDPQPLGAVTITLAEALASRGYRTVGQPAAG